MFLFAQLLPWLSQYLDRQQLNNIARAYLLGADAHEAQLRSSGEPYITHPVAVATILAQLKMDPETVMAAILHDVVEDTDVTRVQLKAAFGEKTAELVDGVTKLTKIQFGSKQEAQAENFRKMMLAMVGDIRVILIKLADRTHNMRTLGALRPDKRRRIARETLEIYAPIANRLGMHDIKCELEDLGFQAMYPMRYRVLKACVERARGNRLRLFERIEQSLETYLNETLVKYELCGRQKRLYSIFKKMRNKGLPLSEIMDVYAFRILCKDRSTCYQLLGAVHALYKPVPGRFKDYIAIPKANGYQSLHTVLFGPYGVPIEIQIRTEHMEHMAKHGIAAHWRYKDTAPIKETEVRTHEWLKRLIDMQRQSGNSLEFIENVKIDLFPDEIYLFTPKGDIFELPRGARVIDFAYAVHTEIGNRCIAAKVNRRSVPLSEKLSSGQTIEIMTAETPCANPLWLEYALTGKAKSAIRQNLKVQATREAELLGKKLFNVALASYQLSWDQLTTVSKAKLLEAKKYASDSALLVDISQGALSTNELADLVCKWQHGGDDEVPITKNHIDISGEEGQSHFATCCYPLPGDHIVGVIEKTKGLVVHQVQCAFFQRLQRKSSQYIAPELRWSENLATQFAAKIRIDAENNRGIIAAISTEITDSAADILNFEVIEVGKQYCIFSIVISVENRVHLARIIRKIRHISAIMRVHRWRE